MSMQDFALQAQLWPTRDGEPIEVASLSPSDAAERIVWAEANAAAILQRHKAALGTDAVKAASRNPVAWWRTTPLHAALAARSNDLPVSLVSTSTSTSALVHGPESGTTVVSEASPLQAAGVSDGSSVDTASEMQRLDQQIAEMAEALSAERLAHSSDARRADEASARAAELERRLAEHEEQTTAVLCREATAAAEARQRAGELAETLAAANAASEQASAALNDTRSELNVLAKRLETQKSQAASVKGLNRIVNGGTGIVLVSVAVLVYVGGAHSAHNYAGWNIWLAALTPLAIEAGAAVELAGLVRNRRLGLPSHWTAVALATGLMGMSITAMLLHATNAPAGSHRWYGLLLAVGLPLELGALVRAALGGHSTDAGASNS